VLNEERRGKNKYNSFVATPPQHAKSKADIYVNCAKHYMVSNIFIPRMLVDSDFGKDSVEWIMMASSPKDGIVHISAQDTTQKHLGMRYST